MLITRRSNQKSFMQKCARIGHNFRSLGDSPIKDVKREKCLDCGREETFTSHSWNADKEYAKAHKRDFIQPWMKEEWNLAYPDKKIVEDPIKQKEMGHDLTHAVGKKKMTNIAEEYVRSFGWHNEAMTKVLRWHLGLED